MDEYGRTNWVLDTMFHDSDRLISDKGTQSFLAKLVTELGQILDFETDSREELLVKVCEYLKSRNVADPYITVIMALLDKGVNSYSRIDQEREKVLENIAEEIVGIKEIPLDANYTRDDQRDDLAMLEADRQKILQASCRVLPGVLEVDLTHQPSSFETACLQASFEDDSPTLDELIETVREQLKDAQEESLSKKQAPDEAKVIIDDHREAYRFVPPEDVEYVESLKPASLALNGEGKISPEVRKWIFGVILLTPEGERKEMVPVIAQVIGAEDGQVRSSLAHLAPRFRARAARGNTPVHQQITEIEGYMERKKGESSAAEVIEGYAAGLEEDAIDSEATGGEEQAAGSGEEEVSSEEVAAGLEAVVERAEAENPREAAENRKTQNVIPDEITQAMKNVGEVLGIESVKMVREEGFPAMEELPLEPEIEVVETYDVSADEERYRNLRKEKGWGEPLVAMSERAWKGKEPLRNRTVCLLETPLLNDVKRLRKLGLQNENLTIVEQDGPKARKMQELLPGANVIHATLNEWLIEKAYERLKGEEKREKKMKELGIPLNGKATLREFLSPPLSVRIPVNPWVFSWVSTHPLFSKYAKLLESFLANPHLSVLQGLMIPAVEEGRFDLMGLDTVSQFSSFQQTLAMIMKLGLLKDDAIMAINMVGSRESINSQHIYSLTLAQQSLHDIKSFDWESKLNGSLSDRRTEGVSLGIMQDLEEGRGIYSANTARNTEGLVFRYLFEETLQMAHDNSKMVAERNLEVYNYMLKNDYSAPKDQKEILAYMLSRRSFEMMLYQQWHKRCIQVFVPFMRQLKPTALKKLATLAAKKQGRRENFFKDFVAMMMVHMLNAHLEESRYIKRHRALEYIGGKRTPMLVDINHLGMQEELFRLKSHHLYSLVLASLLKTEVPFFPKDLVQPIIKTTKYLERQDKLKKGLKREKID